MKPNTKGAWIIHHTKKLQQVDNLNYFDEIHAAGKSGLLLSSLSESENNSTIDSQRVKIISKAAGINPLELPTILQKLKEAQLLDVSSKGDVSVLGLTTSSVLQHTTNLFEKSNPSKLETAATPALLRLSLWTLPFLRAIFAEKRFNFVHVWQRDDANELLPVTNH